MQHRIQIHPSNRPGRHNVTGACRVDYTATPISDAARAILAAGASPSDMLHVAGGDVTILPMSLGSILRPRRAPPKFDRALEVWTSR